MRLHQIEVIASQFGLNNASESAPNPLELVGSPKSLIEVTNTQLVLYLRSEQVPDFLIIVALHVGASSVIFHRIWFVSFFWFCFTNKPISQRKICHGVIPNAYWPNRSRHRVLQTELERFGKQRIHRNSKLLQVFK